MKRKNMAKSRILPHCLENIFTVRAMQIAKEQEENCQHWWNEEHMNDLKTAELRIAYYKQSYEPKVSFVPETPADSYKVKVLCNACDPNNYNGCLREFPKTTEILQEEIIKTYFKDDDSKV